MRKLELVLLFLLSFSAASAQTYDPETGEEIQVQEPTFGPETGIPVEEVVKPEIEEPEGGAEEERSMTISEKELRSIIREEIVRASRSISSTVPVGGLQKGSWYRGVPSGGEEGVLVDRAGREFQVKLYGYDGNVVKFKVKGSNVEHRYHIDSISNIRLADGTPVYSSQTDLGHERKPSSPFSIDRILGICCAGGMALVFLGALL